MRMEDMFAFKENGAIVEMIVLFQQVDDHVQDPKKFGSHLIIWIWYMFTYWLIMEDMFTMNGDNVDPIAVSYSTRQK